MLLSVAYVTMRAIFFYSDRVGDKQELYQKEQHVRCSVFFICPWEEVSLGGRQLACLSLAEIELGALKNIVSRLVKKYIKTDR
ncbi:MAG: hypothetical protein CSA33_01325 [Desulfobulbus propionicus]|nr:MAG: hypothetical protein CSA33_01325 [Desulfobulbus propionicus]